MSLKDIAEEIVDVINETTNDYDARDEVLKILIENLHMGELGGDG